MAQSAPKLEAGKPVREAQVDYQAWYEEYWEGLNWDALVEDELFETGSVTVTHYKGKRFVLSLQVEEDKP